MEEFDDLPRRRTPRQYTYRGSYRRPGSITGSFNPAANVLSAIEEVEGKFIKRKKDIDLFEQQAIDRRLKLQEMVDDTKTLDDAPFKNQITQEFSRMVDDLYRSDIESFDGDRTNYMQKANNAQKAIGDFKTIVGLLDADVNEYKDKSPAELKKLVLRSQFLGDNNIKKKDYLAFLNDPSKMGMRIQNGELIITNNGKDLFNGTRYLNSKKNGYSLIEYGDDYTKQIDAASKDAMQGIGDLAIIRKYEQLSEDGKKLTGFTDVDYRKAVEAYKDNLMNSDKIDALINESTFQRYVDNDEVYDDKKHFEETKTAIINDLIKRQFPTSYRTKQTDTKLVNTEPGDEEVTDSKVRLSFIDAKKAIEDFDTRKLRSGKTTKELVEEFYDRNLKKAEEDTKKITDDEGNTLSPKERVDVFLEESDAWKKLTNPITSTFDDYLGKDVDIGGKKYQISDFTLGVDDDGDFVVIPTYLDIEGKPAEFTQSIQYKLNESGIEALNDDLLQAGSEQFTRPDPITLPSNSEYQARLTNAKSGDIITKPDGTKVEVLKQNGKTYIKNI